MLNKFKLELFKLKIILQNKNMILNDLNYSKNNNLNINYYFKEYIKNKKSTNNLIFLNIIKMFKNIKLFVDFLLLGNKNFFVFNIILKIFPGLYTNWYNTEKNILFPNICIILNNNQKAENFFYNELSKLKIFQIIFNKNFSFYKKLNIFDFFIAINLKNNLKNFYIFIKFLKKFNILSKIYIYYIIQNLYIKILFKRFFKLIKKKLRLNKILIYKIKKKIFLKKIKIKKKFLLNIYFNFLKKKINFKNFFFKNKNTHYWTRTNTLKYKNRF